MVAMSAVRTAAISCLFAALALDAATVRHAGIARELRGEPHPAQQKMAAVNSTQSKMATANSTQSKMATVNSSQPKMVAVNSTQSKKATVNSSQSKMAAVNSTQSKMATVNSSQPKMVAVNSSQSKMAAVNSSQSKKATFNSTQSKKATFNSSQSKKANSSQSKKLPSSKSAAVAHAAPKAKATIAQNVPANHTSVVVAAAKTYTCGANRRLEVGKKYGNIVQSLHVHKDYMCKCLKTELVTGSLYFEDDRFQIQLGHSAEESFESGSSEFRMCQAMAYLRNFGDFHCSYQYGWDEMKAICGDHLN